MADYELDAVIVALDPVSETLEFDMTAIAEAFPKNRKLFGNAIIVDSGECSTAAELTEKIDALIAPNAKRVVAPIDKDQIQINF